MKVECTICPHQCKIEEGHRGLCRGRINLNGEVVCENYGLLTAIALDPIEKKPLKHFYPGHYILSVGSYGCNLNCNYCQNSEISMDTGARIHTEKVLPQALVEHAYSLQSQKNIGIAFTYNEPLISYEYVRDCAIRAKEYGLKNVIVTNGYICQKPLMELLPWIDAMNIDLKAFTERFYHSIRGDLETVKNTICTAAKQCHIEVTNLIIPGENDSEDEMRQLSQWLSTVNPDIPLHVTRFFPRWKMQNTEATSVKDVYRLADIARENLNFVHVGNC